MENSKLSVGDPTKARCTKCRKNTVHTILVVVADKPNMVECGVCNRQHLYRPPTEVKKKVVRQTVQRKDAERKEWTDLQLNLHSSRVRTYSMTEAYRVNALVNHPVFGLGKVQRVVGEQKVEILFADGCKTMRCK